MLGPGRDLLLGFSQDLVSSSSTTSGFILISERPQEVRHTQARQTGAGTSLTPRPVASIQAKRPSLPRAISRQSGNHS